MQHPRPLLLAIAIICLSALGTAVYLQHYQDLLPCPLCIIQRYVYLGIALFCLLGAITKRPKLGAGLALVSALGGIGVAAKHLYVLANPGLSCGIDPLETRLNKIFTAQYLPSIFRAEGLCEDATAPFLGLSIPQWSLAGLIVLTLALVLVLVLVARRR